MAEEPSCDFPSDEEIEQSAPSTVAQAERWLAEWFERRKLGDPAEPPAAEEEEPPPQRFRYIGGASHVPETYDDQVCVLVGEARRQRSRRVAFEDGLVTSIKVKLLEEIGGR